MPKNTGREGALGGIGGGGRRSSSCLAPTSLLSFPQPQHGAQPGQDTGPGPHMCRAGCPQLGTAPALHTPRSPPGVLQCSPLLYILYIALPCHRKGRFAQIRHNSMVSVSKKKKKKKQMPDLFDSCAVTAVTAALRIFFFFCDLILKPHFLRHCFLSAF